jgi:hypothetical protein
MLPHRGESTSLEGDSRAQGHMRAPLWVRKRKYLRHPKARIEGFRVCPRTLRRMTYGETCNSHGGCADSEYCMSSYERMCYPCPWCGFGYEYNPVGPTLDCPTKCDNCMKVVNESYRGYIESEQWSCGSGTKKIDKWCGV